MNTLASSSPERRRRIDVNEVIQCIHHRRNLQIENCCPPANVKKQSIYTKLPEYSSRGVKGCAHYNLPAEPRLRKIVELVDDKDIKVDRSLSLQPLVRLPIPLSAPSEVRRKSCKIIDDHNTDLHPNFSKSHRNTPTRSFTRENQKLSKWESPPLPVLKTPTSPKKTFSTKNTSLAVTNRKTMKLKNAYNGRINDKSNEVIVKKDLAHCFEDVTITEPKKKCTKIRVIKGALNKIKTKQSNEEMKTNKPDDHNIYGLQVSKAKYTIVKENKSKKPVIIVPLEEEKKKSSKTRALTLNSNKYNLIRTHKNTNILNTVKPDDYSSGDRNKKKSVCSESKLKSKYVSTGTNSITLTAEDKFTEYDNMIEISNDSQCLADETYFDTLDVPDVSLTKDKKILPNGIPVGLCIQLPDCRRPMFTLSHRGVNIEQQRSLIISKAMVTCTTRHEIDFHILHNHYQYPLNIIHLLKKKFENEAEKDKLLKIGKITNIKENMKNCLQTQTLTCDKSINLKPSDVSSIRNSVTQCDYDCEQFQRELKFINSFIESLQYLESCSATDCNSEDKKENIFSDSENKQDHYHLLSKAENDGHNDTETMASKSLCLLNLLLRDEQRRAKNLLFVLKMREDALKDFTKSQILWLESKKKLENIDISVVKKKQRGALLKLQHECGEMQRMRKALLALTEKRKLVLMKTKKNIELKLKSNVDLIFLGKKFRKSSSPDRNIAPLKCFNLSSTSCCEESRSGIEADETRDLKSVEIAEKCCLTGDSPVSPETEGVNKTTDTAAEKFVCVDGIFLNILFGNLTLPQIFSAGRTYEVKEEALKYIVSSANTTCDRLNKSNNLEKLVYQLNPELEVPSSPSTARSLVEELDQYYKGLMGDENTKTATSEPYKETDPCDVIDNKISNIYISMLESPGNISNTSGSSNSSNYVSVPCDDLCSFESNVKVGNQASTENGKGAEITSSPLALSAGASLDRASSIYFDSRQGKLEESRTEASKNCDSSIESVVSIQSTLSNFEAEELRLRQLAIEKEIKALEQQQCQLLTLREIPDKPPPPYTPPNDVRMAKTTLKFAVDNNVEKKIKDYIGGCKSEIDDADEVDLFIRDFCYDTVSLQNVHENENPWDASNLMPQTACESEDIVNQAIRDLKEVLKGNTSTVNTSVSTRRWDHIDDILFSEWRRCEPEWTSLHTNEAYAKNQTFETIIQKILAETVKEYNAFALNEIKS